MNLENKVAIITGSARGIGWAIANQFIKNNAKVVFADCAPIPNACKKHLSDGNGIYIETDISSENSIIEMTKKTKQAFGRIDFLINNAATGKNLPISQLSLSQWQKVIDVNLTGAFLCTKYCLDDLIANKGAIVNISSTRALMSQPNTEAYSATKAALIGLTHSLALSLTHKVRVNCISPGWIDTRKSPDDKQDPAQFPPQDHLQHPAGRVGTPDDIANMAIYLCSEKASFITGQNFIIDGGMTRKMIYL